MTITWITETRKVSDLKDFGDNPRHITKKGMEDLSKSIKRLGYIDPIAINTDGTIIGGHARKKALIELGLTEVDVRVPNRTLTNKEIQEAIIRLNKNIAGEWDFDKLANCFEISELVNWGFEQEELGIFDSAGLEEQGRLDESANKPKCPTCGQELYDTKA